MVYDYQGRRTIKRIYNWDTNSSSFILHSSFTYVYDGWNEIARYENNTLTKTYTWGEDLSGSLQGAGGVGGLLITSVYVGAGPCESVLPAYDGNGNITAYLNATDGTEAATYEYSPFGRGDFRVTPTILTF